MNVAKALYQALRFFANWLQQPTLIEVAGAIEVKGGTK
jgi:hypothetical protein